MLGKVMKHDFRANGRLLLPLCGLGLASSAIIRLLIWMSPMLWQPIQQAVGTVAASLGVLVILAVVILSMVAVVYRFYQTFASSQGYLTFSLPVPVGTQLASRLLVSVVYIAASTVVAFLCAVIIVPGFFSTVGDLFASIAKEQSWLEAALLCAAGLAGIAMFQLRIYLSIAIGTQFGRHRIIGGVVGYFILNTIEGIVSTSLLTALFSYLLENSNSPFNRGFPRDPSLVTPYKYNSSEATIIFFVAATVLFIIMGCVQFFATRYIFTKRINLE